ncbi:acyl-CoA carboxylase biotin carboxyl carrier protein subunit, partial [Pararhodobacter sp.]
MIIIRAQGAAIVADLRVAVGDRVAPGDVLLVTELMKMHHEIRAEEGGLVRALHVAMGQEL